MLSRNTEKTSLRRHGFRSINGRRNNRLSSINTPVYETVLKAELEMQEGVVRSADAQKGF